MRRLVSDAPISVSAPQPTMVKHSSDTIRTMLSSTPPSSIRRTSVSITIPATISSTLMAMDIRAAFFTLRWSCISSLVRLNLMFFPCQTKIPCDAFR